MTTPFYLITLVGAYAGPDRVIGKNGTLPWRCKADLQHFKHVTMGKVCIVGRTTYEGLPPLLGRRLVVLTSRPLEDPSVRTASTVDEAIQVATQWSHDHHGEVTPTHLLVIGGEQMYRTFMPYATWMILTTLHLDTPVEGDAHFPAWVKAEWQLMESRSLEGEPHAVVKQWRRRSPSV